MLCLETKAVSHRYFSEEAILNLKDAVKIRFNAYSQPDIH